MERIDTERSDNDLRYSFASIANENFDLEVEEIANEDDQIFGEIDLVHEELINTDNLNADEPELNTEVGNTG